MNKHRQSRASLIASIVLLLLLPVLYVGSYLGLVVPKGRLLPYAKHLEGVAGPHYRVDGDWPGAIYWPMEQIDRKVRPRA